VREKEQRVRERAESERDKKLVCERERAESEREINR
jgi:hypothetical protein